MSLIQNISADHGSVDHQNIADSKLKQLRHECESWKRQLCFMLEETVCLKTRLSEILKDGIDENLLEEIENFQTMFIREDDLIGSLRKELSDFDKMLVREIFEDGIILKKVNSKIESLRHNITATENGFSKLKSEFNNYILENI